MIAAVYARKSSDQAVADDAKSVTRQVEHARAYAGGKTGPSSMSMSTWTTESPGRSLRTALDSCGS